MLEVPQEIKSSWLNFYEGHDSEIDGSFSSVEAAVTKKANNILGMIMYLHLNFIIGF